MKQVDDAGNTRVYCLFPGCTQKTGWVSIKGSISNIRNHLMIEHHLNTLTQKDDAYIGPTGCNESVSTNQGKRFSAHFSVDTFE